MVVLRVDATVSGAISVTKTIQIVNDDADPEIQFSQATASVTEGSSTGSSDIVLQKVYSGSVDATEKTITLAVTKAGSGDELLQTIVMLMEMTMMLLLRLALSVLERVMHLR